MCASDVLKPHNDTQEALCNWADASGVRVDQPFDNCPNAFRVDGGDVIYGTTAVYNQLHFLAENA